MANASSITVQFRRNVSGTRHPAAIKRCAAVSAPGDRTDASAALAGCGPYRTPSRLDLPFRRRPRCGESTSGCGDNPPAVPWATSNIAAPDLITGQRRNTSRTQGRAGRRRDLLLQNREERDLLQSRSIARFPIHKASAHARRDPAGPAARGSRNRRFGAENPARSRHGEPNSACARARAGGRTEEGTRPVALALPSSEDWRRTEGAAPRARDPAAAARQALAGTCGPRGGVAGDGRFGRCRSAAAAAAGRLAALDFPPFGSASGSGFGHHRGPLLLELETCATGLRITCGAWTDPLGAANELNSVQIFVETHSQFCSTTLSRRIAVRTTYVRELQYVRAGGAVEVSRFTLAVWYIRPTHRGLLLPSSIQGIRYSVH